MRLIDADAIKRRVVIGGSEQCKKCALAEMLYDIVNAPTVDAQPIIHAKWVDAPKAPAYKDSYKCSNCYTGAIHDMNGYSVLTRYCSYCGAKMNKHHNRMGEVTDDV